MHRIAGLITRLTEATHSPMPLRSLAEFAAHALVEVFPTACVVLFEIDPHEPLARVIGGANLPPSWLAHAVRLPDAPQIAEAMMSPERLIGQTVRDMRHGAALENSPAGRLQTICAAVPEAGGAQYALMFIAPPLPTESPVREAAIEVARRLIAARAELSSTERSSMQAAIHHAKLEWEHTADELREIVGLLDSQGRVVRISRAVERWQLGTVRQAIGRDLHSLLHPSCGDPHCPLRSSLALATSELGRAPHAIFEIADPVSSLDLAVCLSAAARADGSAPTRPHRVVFTVSNVTSLRCAERELKALNQTLEERVEQRSSELLATNRALRGEVTLRREAEKSLRRSARDLELLSERLMSAQECERKRISQDLHDSVGQMLSAVKYSMERAQELARRGVLEEASGVIDVSIRRLQRLMDEVRTISMNLRPSLLDDLGAVSAVRALCRDWQDVYGSVAVETDIAIDDTDIPPLLITNVYRAVQESLNNVARHAAAERVQVSMRIVAGVLSVAVCDDGVGFSVDGENSPTAGTRGLRGLRERAERTGGRCEVSSAPGQGTTVLLEWPLAVGQAARLVNASLN